MNSGLAAIETANIADVNITGTLGTAENVLVSKDPIDVKSTWPNKKEDYKLGKVIGSGATAVVQEAVCLPLQKNCAVKRINLEKCTSTVEELLKEIQAMSVCQHENVVQYYTSFVVREELWVVMQLCDGGSLLDIIKNEMKKRDCKNGVLDEATIATVLREVLLGLDYFHSSNEIHRDIKAGNILVSLDGSIRIADFGVAAFISNSTDAGENLRHTFVGTPCWMAPEVMEQSTGYNSKADIWSLGITAIELATGYAPYHKYPPMKVLMLTLNNEPPNLETSSEDRVQYKQYGKSLRRFIAACLKKDATERPDAKHLLKHEFLKRAKDKSYIVKTLLASGTAQKHEQVTRVPGTSGRLHKTADGEWVWSDEEFESDPVSSRPGKSLAEDKHAANVTEPAPTTSNAEAQSRPSLSLVLRLRNENNELNDISFDYTSGVDTPDTMSNDLVESGLINGMDRVVVAANLHKIIENPGAHPELKFRLTSQSDQSSQPNPDDELLIGYALLKLDDNPE